MPVNRNQLERLLLIHQEIASGKGPTYQDLAKACIAQLPNCYEKTVISIKRTIFQDIDRLRTHYNAPLENRKRKYYYTEPFALLQSIAPQEFDLLQQLLHIFQQLAEIPIFEGFRALQVKLLQYIQIPEQQVVFFDDNPHYKGLPYLLPIYQAIREPRALKINYIDFQMNRTQHTISPYVLKEYQNRWYIFGWEHNAKKLYNLALDRIQGIEPSDFRYLANKASVEDHLDYIVGVTHFENIFVRTVLLKVALPRAKYLETKPLHHSQKFHSIDATHYVFEYCLAINPELISEILRLGPDAEVLTPINLRQIIIEKANEMSRLYRANTPTA